MSTRKARGQLRHRFHGEYSAVIALGFDSEADASECLPILSAKVNGWEAGKNKKALVWVGNSEELDACTHVLVSFGAEEKKIASLAKSIDYGEPFDVAIDACPCEQVSLLV
jgi:hypothetical protein